LILLKRKKIMTYHDSLSLFSDEKKELSKRLLEKKARVKFWT